MMNLLKRQLKHQTQTKGTKELGPVLSHQEMARPQWDGEIKCKMLIALFLVPLNKLSQKVIINYMNESTKKSFDEIL